MLDVPELLPFVATLSLYSAQAPAAWEDLLDRARAAPPSTVVIVSACDEGGRVPAGLPKLLQQSPSLPVVAAVQLRTTRQSRLQELVSLGVSELLDLGVENTPAAALPRLRASHARPLKARLERALPRSVSGQGLTLLRAAAEVVTDHGGRATLAGIFGVGERTVTGWCESESLPPPRRLLAWLRLLLAAMLLEERHRTVLGVASAAGYANDRGLRRAFETLAGVGIRRGPGRDDHFSAVAEAFAAELRTLGIPRSARRTSVAPPATAYTFPGHTPRSSV